MGTGLKSFMAAPLVVDEDVLGTLELASTTASRFRQQDAALLSRVGQQVSPAVRSARAQSALARESARRSVVPSALAEIARVSSSASDMSEVYRTVAEQTHRMVPFDRLSIWTVDLERGHLVNTFAAGVEVANSDLGASLPLSSPEESSASGDEDASDNKGAAAGQRGGALSDLAQRITGGLRGVLLVPLISNNEGVGMLRNYLKI